MKKFTKTIAIAAAIGLAATSVSVAAANAATYPVAATTKLAVTPSLTEGPYYISGNFKRQNITEGQTGLAQTVKFRVVDTNGKPIVGATVDLWHANGLGQYSGVSDPREGCAACANQTFLRGSQVSDKNGYVTFKTIFAGWYGGRTVHYHVKVWRSGQQVLTTQFFVTKADSDKVYKTYAPYKSKGLQDTTNATDNIARSLGSKLTAVTFKNVFTAKAVTSTGQIVIG